MGRLVSRQQRIAAVLAHFPALVGRSVTVDLGGGPTVPATMLRGEWSGHDAVVADVMAVLVEQGMLLESARGRIPNVAELVAGEPIRGSWWSHRMSHDIFEAINALADSPDVVRLRFVRDKVTLVHSRLWPALARLEDQFPPAALAAIVQEHAASGAHRATSVPFDEWIPANVRRAAAHLTEVEALECLPDHVRTTADADSTKRTHGKAGR